MPEASTGPPAVGSPRIPLPPPAPATATGVVVFSQPASDAPAPAVSASPPARASSDRRVSAEGRSFGCTASDPPLACARLSSLGEGGRGAVGREAPDARDEAP